MRVVMITLVEKALKFISSLKCFPGLSLTKTPQRRPPWWPANPQTTLVWFGFLFESVCTSGLADRTVNESDNLVCTHSAEHSECMKHQSQAG